VVRPMVREVARVAAIGWTCGWSAAPVVSDDLVLLAGGDHGAAAGASDGIPGPGAPDHGALDHGVLDHGDVPVLQAIDAAGERFRFTWPASGREIEPGAVTITPDGDVVLPVYEHDTSLQVLRLARDGTVVARDDLTDEDQYDVVAFDLGSKLRVAVTPLTGEAYLCAWLYRQGRRAGTTYRRWREPGYRWVSEEWPLYSGDGVVIGASGDRWVCRDLETGAVRWFTEAAGYQPLGELAGAFVAIRMPGTGPGPAPVRAGERSAVLALDPRTGGTLWQTPVDGVIRSAATGPRGVSACAERPDGAKHLTELGADGEVAATRSLGDAVIVAATADATLAMTGPGLLAAFSPALDPLWTIAVEPPDLGYAARIADSRLAVVAATVAEHQAYLRGRGGLTTIEW
jgi:hypothetical protein